MKEERAYSLDSGSFRFALFSLNSPWLVLQAVQARASSGKWQRRSPQIAIRYRPCCETNEFAHCSSIQVMAQFPVPPAVTGRDVVRALCSAAVRGLPQLVACCQYTVDKARFLTDKFRHSGFFQTKAKRSKGVTV